MSDPKHADESGNGIKEGDSSSLETSVKDITPVMEYPEGGRQAWTVAIGAASVLFCTFGFSNSFGIFQGYYQTHQLSNKTPDDIAWIGSIQNFFLFASTAFGGPLFDRFGAKVIWPAAIVYVFSVMMTSLCKELYQFILCQGALSGIGMGMTMSPAMAAVGQYFNAKRGAAIGIAVAGSSVGGVIFPIALNKMLNHPKLGFGWSVRVCGFIIAALIIPATASIRARIPPRKSKMFLFGAFKETQYVALLVSIFLMILGILTPLFYLPTFAIQNGMDTELAFYLTAIVNAASFFGRVVPGVLADKVGRLNMLCAAAICTGILCLCWQKATSNTGVIIFAVFYGFCSGSVVSLFSVTLTTASKDPRNIGTYMGMGMFVASFGALVGPPINGALVSHYGGFKQASIFAGVVVLAGGFSVLNVKRVMGKGMFAKV